MKIYSIHDKEFLALGKVLDCPFFELFEKGAKDISTPESGCAYMASVPAFETEQSLKYYSGFFGDMPVQIGYCWGRNDMLNGLEWHKSSEVHCALEDMILLLGNMVDMEGDVFDTKNVKAFLVKKGESVELYQTTLHFCPSMPDEKVFKNVVILPKGTNTPLENKTDDGRLIAKNKWFICHPESTKHVQTGRVVGIKGVNLKV